MRSMWPGFRNVALWVAVILQMAASRAVVAEEIASADVAGSRSRSAVQTAARDLLDAEKEGLVGVRFIPNDSRSAQVIVTNRTKKPLTLRLPAAFVGVPVLAQMGGNQAGAGFGAGGIGAQPQTVGGGGALGAGAGGGGVGAAGAGAAFSIPPEKSRVIRVRSVCLEHGKAEPQPRYPYRLDRFSSYSSDPALQSVLESYGRGEISPQVAQAAAWHLSSGLSWERLAAERFDHVVDEDEPFFSPAELRAARQVVAVSASARRASPAVSGSAAE